MTARLPERILLAYGFYCRFFICLQNLCLIKTGQFGLEGVGKMIDIHTHILTIDDGPKTIGESLIMLRIAKDQGVSKMVATPHYIRDGNDKKAYFFKPNELKEHINKLTKIMDKEKINIDIIPGAEVYYHDKLGKDIAEGLITMINGSRYFLLELPSKIIPLHLINVLYDLYHLGVKPIIAHPERNLKIMKDPNILYTLIKKRVDSIYAIYSFFS